MKILTWNINGLRSMKKTVSDILKEFDADVVCFQETKISRNLLPEEYAIVENYTSYFSFPKKQSGYSGVATFCNNEYTPFKAEEGLTGGLPASDNLEDYDLTALDGEGRVIITHHELSQCEGKTERLALINVYCPRVDPEKPERHVYKMQFLDLLAMKASALLKEGCSVIILGDLNIAHRTIDHCDPVDEEEFNASEPRQWLTELLRETSNSAPKEFSFVDVYRQLHPKREKAYTCWNTKIGARLTNYGTRIDYILIDSASFSLVALCEILSGVFGSDHCPVLARLECEGVPSSQIPLICTRWWPEYAGKQQKLISFLQKPNANNQKHPSSAEENSIAKKSKSVANTNKQKSIKNFFGFSETQKSSQTVLPQLPTQMLNLETKELETETFPENHLSAYENVSASQNKQSELWKSVLSGPPKPPPCSGHNEPCVLRTVKKKGPNYGRQFFSCSKPTGLSSNADSSCNFFQWVTSAKKNTPKCK